jgi:hypothetical protein
MHWTSRLVLNSGTLDHSGIPVILEKANPKPLYRHLASHQVAWQRTRGVPGVPPSVPPVDSLVWATTATKYATSWQHMDANGFATAVDGVAGAKYWVVARSRHPGGNVAGDLASRFAYQRDWHPYQSYRDGFIHEAVVIRPGTVL